jgi:flagellar hook-associated protein 2
MSDSSTIFSGTSRYASDFQSLISRAVSIASLPLTQLTIQKTALQAESTALSTLDTKFSSLQSAITSLETATGSGSFAASVSDETIVSATVSTGALEGIYSIEVTSLGSYTNTMSKDGLTTVTDPSTQNIYSASSFTLTINGTPTTITPAANTLNDLVEAINATDLEVRASIVNIGSTDSPDYRLSIQSTNLAGDTIQLADGATSLMDTLSTGANATYKVNGRSTAVSSDSRTITLAPGLSVQLLAASETGVATTITVSRSTSAISNALLAFVTAYNAAVDELDKHRGDSGGALAGQSIVFTLSQALRDVAQYSGDSGAITSLTELGLTFDGEGKLSLDTSTFSSAASDNMKAVLTFLGSTTESGFLKSATDLLYSLEDTTDGLIKTAISSLEAAVAAQDDRIAAEQDRVDRVRENLVAQMAAADALIAALEQQASYITDLFESMRIAAGMYQ